MADARFALDICRGVDAKFGCLKNPAREQCPRSTDILESVAGNGLLHRRALLGRGIMLAGTAATGISSALTAAAAEPMVDGPWTNEVGAVILDGPLDFRRPLRETLGIGTNRKLSRALRLTARLNSPAPGRKPMFELEKRED
jgi:hypothetical protein